MYNSVNLTRFAPTLIQLFGIQSQGLPDQPISSVTGIKEQTITGNLERMLIYNPDAIGMWLYQKYTEDFHPVLENTQLAVPIKAVMPSVTPVCFGTMYTGLEPSGHGIKQYEKKRIDATSVFDILQKQGKKIGIIAVEGSSMASIFSGKDMDYFILPYDQEVNEKALELVKENIYDLLIVYNQEYDDTMHQTGPESTASLNAMKNHINTFADLNAAVKKHWSKENAMVCWATDHGIHIQENGLGTHGSDSEEDLNIMHFYGYYPKK